MAYLILYMAGLASIWWIYNVGWFEALKIILSILIPSILIILFNVKAGKFLFRNPIFGCIILIPNSIFIYQLSQPFAKGINTWLDNRIEKASNFTDIIDTELISKEDA